MESFPAKPSECYVAAHFHSLQMTCSIWSDSISTGKAGWRRTQGGSKHNLQGGAGEGLAKVRFLALLVQIQLPDVVQGLASHVRHSVHPHLCHHHALDSSKLYNNSEIVHARHARMVDPQHATDAATNSACLSAHNMMPVQIAHEGTWGPTSAP